MYVSAYVSHEIGDLLWAARSVWIREHLYCAPARSGFS